MAVTKDKKRRTPHVIKAATFLLVAGFLLLSGCNAIKKFNKRQEQIGNRYWQNAINTKEYKKHYSPGNPNLVRKRH